MVGLIGAGNLRDKRMKKKYENEKGEVLIGVK